ncbi:MAG: YceG family protein [Eubacteriales bacterium]|nr:YceG family protein [Eubacteriales bacterium]
MWKHQNIGSLDDFFLKLKQRAVPGVYFYRVAVYSEQIDQWIRRYYEAARTRGVVIEGRIPNPDEKNLSYYYEMMGEEFLMNAGFFQERLKKWLPRLRTDKRAEMAGAIYDSLDALRRQGKNENMLKNAYIKYMCWLYYRFERVVNLLGEEDLPKILYEGEVSNYELLLLGVLSSVGCDIVLLEYQGDAAYQKLDPQERFSTALQMAGTSGFPAGYSLKKVREEQQKAQQLAQLIPQTTQVNATNTWITGKGFEDVLKEGYARGKDERFFYNCFCRIRGVEDRLTYTNELLRYYEELKGSGRKIQIFEHEIPAPTPEEISGIRRGNYQNREQMLMDLSRNLQKITDAEVRGLAVKALMELLLALPKEENLNRLTGKAVYLICWLLRYHTRLFADRRDRHELACVLYLGGCRTENEALFLRMLARMPSDVLILVPNRNETCLVEDKLLYEKNYEESLVVKSFPRGGRSVQVGTAAYHAERDLDQLLYQGTGMYRSMQFQRADALTLRTMYEEIPLLWDQEVKYRPGFSTTDQLVHIPVIYAKISGVKDGALDAYWRSIKGLLTEDTHLIQEGRLLDLSRPNPMKQYAVEFYKNGKLQRKHIKEHPKFPYSVLREETQECMLDALERVLNAKMIRGIGENGMEYTVIATALNLPKEIIRQIQKFDFTKKNPKLISIHTTEKPMALEDAIAIALLQQIGYDILFFVPTGYQTAEHYFQNSPMEEHQIGEYLYDLRTPDFSLVSAEDTAKGLIGKLFGRKR